MSEFDARNHPAFDAFWRWADENGCQSECYEDWNLWFYCFVAGYNYATATITPKV